MSHHDQTAGESNAICRAIEAAVTERIAGARVEAQGGGGHYTVRVVSEVFEGQGPVQRQRLVLSAIAHLMKGDGAPVHAIDKLETLPR